MQVRSMLKNFEIAQTRGLMVYVQHNLIIGLDLGRHDRENVGRRDEN
jgi:hypothetical protein